MNKTILLTGASGLIGRSLTEHLLQKGYAVHHLVRSGSRKDPRVKTFLWDVKQGQIDERCIEGIGAIVHLAGEGIATKPWTNNRKQQIVESRTESISLLYSLLKNKEHKVTKIVSSSAVGFYGDRGNELLTEESGAGNDFLSKACIEWEQAVDRGTELGIKIVKLRTGIVLSKEGGALPQLAKPVSLGLGTILGSGKQWMPWIHIHDVVRIYEFFLINEELSGTFNMAAPHPDTNTVFTQKLASLLNKPLWLPRVPALALRILLGEMCAVVLNSNRTSSDKIQSLGFTFDYPLLKDALTDIYGSRQAD